MSLVIDGICLHSSLRCNKEGSKLNSLLAWLLNLWVIINLYVCKLVILVGDGDVFYGQLGQGKAT